MKIEQFENEFIPLVRKVLFDNTINTQQGLAKILRSHYDQKFGDIYLNVLFTSGHIIRINNTSLRLPFLTSPTCKALYRLANRINDFDYTKGKLALVEEKFSQMRAIMILECDHQGKYKRFSVSRRDLLPILNEAIDKLIDKNKKLK